MSRRRTPVASARTPAKSKAGQSPPHGDPMLATRPRAPLAREWLRLPEQARVMGLDWRTLRKHVAGEPFVRVLGGRWYVHREDCLAWWARQRPRERRHARRGT